MAIEAVAAGDILLIALPVHDPKGHEQEGVRPAVVVGVPQGPVRYPVVIVVPLTTRSGPWAKQNPILYQPLPPGAGGIPQASIVLIDQVRAVDVRRIKAYLGSLEEKTFEPIRSSLLKLFQKKLFYDQG
ncbi:Plasmid maintenance toxin/Cell growth inhibitor [Moorella glycerini]|uniref:mRNA interferase MazF n=1 Tax=Neomoorella stamsii TaxID=1266720 RepID=A0A9X7J082_9FIRM|nr:MULTISPECIES: type II toxin-antitoxin system PemK/MazF family toxin [Moorella]PRR69217.1 mRNA interferase MazF [Moorella stamsii]CEP67955.1 Plasmid maintenance toxin/Cell growth inhibitor [Moorella glycerini]